MPTYVFINNVTGNKEEHKIKMAELDSFKKENTHLSQTIAETKVGDPVSMGRKKIDPEFKDVLRNIGERTPGGKGLTQYIDSAY